MLVRLALRHLFGLRVCPFCPNCNSEKTPWGPCQDLEGSNAEPFGGVFGRVDAVYGSLEHQKSGSLHIHMQVFVQCLHQHTPLVDVMAEVANSGDQLIEGYLAYKRHVCKETYADVDLAKQRQDEIEESWPEHAESLVVVSRPSYQTDEAMSREEWREEYTRDVQSLQELKQHHVHPKDAATGERKLLTHCTTKSYPGRCRSRFPREDEKEVLAEDGVILCKALAELCGLSSKGKKNMLGCLVGPRNDEWLNGTHPALLAGLRCNSDVQIPRPVCNRYFNKRNTPQNSNFRIFCSVF